MHEKILVVLADGFEEIEALGAVDVLRRLQFAVTTAALGKETQVVGCHGIPVVADTLLEKCGASGFNAVVLPGGMPGAENLRKSEKVRFLLQSMALEGKIVAAICAAPMVLAEAGLLQGRRFTMYPGFENFLGGLVPSGNAVEADGNVITGRGLGALFDFCEKIAQSFGAKERIAALYRGMFVQR